MLCCVRQAMALRAMSPTDDTIASTVAATLADYSWAELYIAAYGPTASLRQVPGRFFMSAMRNSSDCHSPRICWSRPSTMLVRLNQIANRECAILKTAGVARVLSGSEYNCRLPPACEGRLPRNVSIFRLAGMPYGCALPACILAAALPCHVDSCRATARACCYAFQAPDSAMWTKLEAAPLCAVHR